MGLFVLHAHSDGLTRLEEDHRGFRQVTGASHDAMFAPQLKKEVHARALDTWHSNRVFVQARHSLPMFHKGPDCACVVQGLLSQ